MTTLETLFSPVQKEKLRQAAWVRTSCRSFAGAPDTAAFAALSYVVGRCALPGARLVLTPVDESLFTGTILGMGRITGCTMAAVVIACGTEAVSVNSPTGTQFFHKFRCQLLMQFQGDIAQCILQCRSCLRRRKRITTVGGPPDTFYESWVGR